ncbi:hypothetical protein NDU88_006033, partial [Pleurodeles waltl]
MDMLSRWPEILITSDITSQSITNFLSGVFSREGYPKCIITDNGVQFTSKHMYEFLASRGILHKKSALYHPETNGMVERFNRTLKETIQVARLTGRSWIEAVKSK